nr:phage tail assembly chaperone [Providencia rustigianii]
MNKLEELRDDSIDDFFKVIIADWAIEEPYNEENLKLLFDNYPSDAGAIPNAQT